MPALRAQREEKRVIIIKIVEGPHAGKFRQIVEGEYEGHKIDPLTLFIQLMELGSRWEINLFHADLDEKIEWGRADMTVRYVRALIEGRPVFCLGTEYRAETTQEVLEVGQLIEDQLVNSGYDVSLGFDNESGVSIVAVRRSNEVQ